MKAGVTAKKLTRFQFVIDELLSIRPTIKRAFGFVYIYLDEKLMLSLRDDVKQPNYNGVWLYTQLEHLESLRQEFPFLPRRCFWRSKKSGCGWVILTTQIDDFEEYAFKACQLVLNGDPRIGRLSRKGRSKSRQLDSARERDWQ